MNPLASNFSAIWQIEFQFDSVPGERPFPTAFAAMESRTGRQVSLAGAQLRATTSSPIPFGGDVLMVGTQIHEVLGCFLTLGWDLPPRALDIGVEAQVAGLLGPGVTHRRWSGTGSLASTVSRSMQCDDGDALHFCWARLRDVDRRLSLLAPRIDLPLALLRGRNLAATSRMEANGIPVDVRALNVFRENWRKLRRPLIAHIDGGRGFFDGMHLRLDRLAQWIESQGTAWPRRRSGALDLGDEVFRRMARLNPTVAAVRSLTNLLDEENFDGFTVGRDGCCRTPSNPFGTLTSRNTPSSKAFPFSAPSWQRFLVKPEPGRGMAMLDFSGAEIGIAAALSGDGAMWRSYQADMHLELAVRAGIAPPGATKETHRAERDVGKECSLSAIYGIGAPALAAKTGLTLGQAERLLSGHRASYPKFWQWIDRAVASALLTGEIHSPLGWKLHVGRETNPLTIRNFVPQATCGDVMRLAAIYATEAGIRVLTTVHDAMVVGAPLEQLPHHIALAGELMEQASRECLGGFALRIDVKTAVYPDRLGDPRGASFWDHLVTTLKEVTGFDVDADDSGLERHEAAYGP